MRAVLSDLGQDHEWITSIEDDRFENQTGTLICYKVNFNSNDCLCTCFVYSVSACLYILQELDRESWSYVKREKRFPFPFWIKLYMFKGLPDLAYWSEDMFYFHFRLSLFSDFWIRFWFCFFKHIYQPSNILNKIYIFKTFTKVG